MLIDLVQVAAGLALVLGGGEWLVRGAAVLAARLGVAPAVVGLTVVAFGTSAPELVVGVVAAAEGRPGLALGNVVGSNVANIGLLLGLTALLSPVAVHSGLLAREMPLLALASLAALVLAADRATGSAGSDLLGLQDGIVLLLLFGIFLYAMTTDVVRTRRTAKGGREDPLLAEARQAEMATSEAPMALTCGRIVAGLAGLIVGGDLLVGGASAVALAAGVPEVVIGATIVAVGTSLPELVTCVLAARRGESDLAVGNVVGSNLFNLLLVLGVTAVVAPVPVAEGGLVDLAVSLVLAVVLLPLAFTGRRIDRLEGGLLVASWVLYVGWRVMGSG